MKKDMLNEALVVEITRNISTAVRAVYPDTPVLPVLGNHDWWPKNDLPTSNHPLYDQFADMWRDWISEEEAQATFRKGKYIFRTAFMLSGHIEVALGVSRLCRLSSFLQSSDLLHQGLGNQR